MGIVETHLIIITRGTNHRLTRRIVGHGIGRTIELWISVVGTLFVTPEHEVLIVSGHHQRAVIDRRRENWIHLLVQPVVEPGEIIVCATQCDCRIDFRTDFIVKRRRAAPGALRHEAPDVPLEGISRRVLPIG